MTEYPEWVLKFKKKGTYINCVKGKYYLYAAHSERIPGTKKVKRVCDGYLGRITLEKGLIPPKDKVSGDVLVFEYGLSSTILSLCSTIHSALRRNFKQNADFIMSAAILTVMHGYYSQLLFEHSFLSVRYPDTSLLKAPTAKQDITLKRTVLMIEDKMKVQFREDLPLVKDSFFLVHKIKINNCFYLEKLSDTAAMLKQNHHVAWED